MMGNFNLFPRAFSLSRRRRWGWVWTWACSALCSVQCHAMFSRPQSTFVKCSAWRSRQLLLFSFFLLFLFAYRYNPTMPPWQICDLASNPYQKSFYYSRSFEKGAWKWRRKAEILRWVLRLTTLLHILNTQGCCLTGARSPEAPKLRVRATKVLFKEPEWAPKDRVFIPN